MENKNTNGLVRDAVKIASNIYDSLTPYEDWVIVNICKSHNWSFTYPDCPEIPTGFGYIYDKVPDILEKDGVIEAKTNKWFIGLTTKPYSSENPKNLPIYDTISIVARAKKYFNKETRAEYYKKYDTSTNTYEGPKVAGQYSALINVKKLIKFIRWYGNQSPRFNSVTGELSYLGYSLKFSGLDKINAVKLLVDNIGSIVRYKDFYEIREGVNFDSDIKTQKQKIQNSLESMYKSIKNDVTSSDLKSYIVLAQQNGFGMFINHLNPEKTPK